MNASLLFILLALAGLAVSLYFTLLYYGVLPYRMRAGIFCYDKKACEDILQSPYSKIFGFPNALGGLFFYAIILLQEALHVYPWIIWALTFWVFLFSLYLAYILHYRLKSFCALCSLAHVINFALFFLTTARVLST